MAPPVVILKTDVHCYGCAMMIWGAVANMHGVDRVWASPDTDLVIVAGTADAKALQHRIYRTVGRSVTIVSDGLEEEDRTESPYYGMIHLQPPPEVRRRPQYYSWWETTATRRPYHHYAALPVGYDDYPYRGSYSAPPPPHHRHAAPPVGYSYPYGDHRYSYPYGDGYYYEAPEPWFSY